MDQVAYHTHALPGSKESGAAEHEEESGQGSPPASSSAESDDDSSNDSHDDEGDAKTPGKEDPRTVAIADGPSNEIGVSLMAEGPFDCVYYFSECRRMSGIGKSVE